MAKDLHNMDEIFNSAYKQFSEEPSQNVWEKINARLDKKDAAAYKRKSKNWKRVAILSLLLLTASILYEALTTGEGHSKQNAGIRKPDQAVQQTDKALNPHNLP